MRQTAYRRAAQCGPPRAKKPAPPARASRITAAATVFGRRRLMRSGRAEVSHLRRIFEKIDLDETLLFAASSRPHRQPQLGAAPGAEAQQGLPPPGDGDPVAQNIKIPPL